MNLSHRNLSKRWMRGFGMGVVLAAVLGIGGWLTAEASSTQGRPALPERVVVAAPSTAPVQMGSHDPLVIAMDNWEQTAGNNTVSKTKKNKKNGLFFFDDYWSNYLFYYFLFYNNYHGDHSGYNTYYPIYFNYFWYFF